MIVSPRPPVFFHATSQTPEIDAPGEKGEKGPTNVASTWILPGKIYREVTAQSLGSKGMAFAFC